ncbi:hypothetical protein KFE25_005553 [Diacronema lutheri]|uniref:Uncharacterized protein n=1 Tax=Diacronema lutheri TaxID=2081491 RepID=A0A8J6CFT2_DIALT|nr:hypothetical protein KFE25_005553 [Diacronema lutheri]
MSAIRGRDDTTALERAREQRAAMWSDTRETVLMQMLALEEALSVSRRGEAGALSFAQAADVRIASLEANESAARTELRNARVEIVRLTEEASELRVALDDCHRLNALNADAARASPRGARGSRAPPDYTWHAASAQHGAMLAISRAIHEANADLDVLHRALDDAARVRASAHDDLVPLAHRLLASLAAAASAHADAHAPPVSDGGAREGPARRAHERLREAEALALRLHAALGALGETDSARSTPPARADALGGGGPVGAALRAVSAALERAASEVSARQAELQAELHAAAETSPLATPDPRAAEPAAGAAGASSGARGAPPSTRPTAQRAAELDFGEDELGHLATRRHHAARMVAAHAHADAARREAEVERARARQNADDAARARADAEQLRRRLDADADAAARALRDARATRDAAERRVAALAEANSALEAEAVRLRSAARARDAALDEARAARSEATDAAATLRARAALATGALDAALDARVAAERYREEAERSAARERLRAANLIARAAEGSARGDSPSDGARALVCAPEAAHAALLECDASADPALRVGGGYTTLGAFFGSLSPRGAGQHARLDSDEGHPDELEQRLRALSPPGARPAAGGAGAIVRGGRGSKLRVVTAFDEPEAHGSPARAIGASLAAGRGSWRGRGGGGRSTPRLASASSARKPAASGARGGAARAPSPVFSASAASAPVLSILVPSVGLDLLELQDVLLMPERFAAIVTA